ncbi:DJ-1/PfpI family protein [Streptococcus marmotae]|uniref:DJ-1/PfpI family protein n=1 Tax=Streptococcus marmotae TaxID=1825069 RepID=UPI0008332B9F|nr:DJ-1/PfpI family protein [Streptococcus marmotae]
MKIGLCLYDQCSIQEISLLISILSLDFGQKIDYLASEQAVVQSEEGLLVMPTHSFDEVNPLDYDCLMLTGTMNPLKSLYDERLIGFLREIDTGKNLLAAISSSVMFIAKAGILKGKDYTGGLFMDFVHHFDFLDEEHFKPCPVLVSDGVITGMAFGTRKFAIAVLRGLGFEVPDTCGILPEDDYTEEELRFYFSPEIWQEVLADIQRYEAKRG